MRKFLYLSFVVILLGSCKKMNNWLNPPVTMTTTISAPMIIYNLGLQSQVNWQYMQYNLDSALVTFMVTGERTSLIDSLLGSPNHYYKNLRIVCDGDTVARADTIPAKITLPVYLMDNKFYHFIHICDFDTTIYVGRIDISIIVHQGEIVNPQNEIYTNGGTIYTLDYDTTITTISK